MAVVQALEQDNQSVAPPALLRHTTSSSRGRAGSYENCGFSSHEDADTIRMGANTLTTEEFQMEDQWTSLREKASEEDLTDFEKMGALYQAGIDKQGRPVIVFIGKWFKPGSVDMEKALLYLIRILDPVADQDYSVVFFCTRTGSENYLAYWSMKDIYFKLPYHYKKNLKAFYIVHPSMWTRLTTWWFSTFMAPNIKHKIHNVYAVTELESHIHSTQFEIPMFIQEYDMTINGLRFSQP